MSKAVYRDYDQESLEYQYGPRVAVPNTDEILARWAANSEAYYAASDCVCDIAYGPRAEETLDIFKPAGADKAPVLIFIHGGYWRALDKKDHAFLPKPFVDAGILVASINYTLCPEVTIDEITRQARAACAWVWRNAASHGGDPDRVHVFGHSAGGHLTGAMAATDWPAYDSGLPQDMLKSATPISGLFDLEPILLTSVNDDVHLDAESAVRNSPVKSAPGSRYPDDRRRRRRGDRRIPAPVENSMRGLGRPAQRHRVHGIGRGEPFHRDRKHGRPGRSADPPDSRPYRRVRVPVRVRSSPASRC